MDGLGTRLATITGLRIYDFPPDSLAVPAAIVSFPDSIDYDSTFGRGSDECTIPVHVVIGKVSDRNARDQLVLYLNGTGTKSIKAVIEADVTLNGSAQTSRVTIATIQTVSMSGAEYLSARFMVHVIS